MAKAKAKAKKTPKRKSAPRKSSTSYDVDWSDPVSVESALDKHFTDDIEDFEEDRGYSGFREGTVYRFKSGGAEYAVAEDDDAAEKLAVAIVLQDLQDLQDSPENFEQNFIESHIDKDRLRRDLHSDVWDSNYERLKEEAERSPMEFLKDNGLDIPEPSRDKMQEHAEAMSDDETSAADIMKKLNAGDAEDKWIEMGEEPEVPEKELNDLAESETESQLKDPVSYLEDIYGREDAVKKAIEIGGIDENAAALEAVSVDGAGHFLSGYDGNLNMGPAGIVYWRTN